MRLLDVRGLVAGYAGTPVVVDITLQLDEGDFCCLLGPNGAGKTTLLSTIIGLLPVMRGSIEFRGLPVVGRSVEERVRMGLALVPEGRRVFTEMSVEDNLIMGSYTAREGLKDSLEKVYGLFPVLRERRRMPAGLLSGGEQQMLAIGRALMSRPRVLLLDEPSLGLAPLLCRSLFGMLRQLSDSEGIAVLLAEQNARLALQVAKSVLVLDRGRLVFTGSSGEFAVSLPEIREALLGA
jgi:branched-chain amino acid transport system ATP-binding protein